MRAYQGWGEWRVATQMSILDYLHTKWVQLIIKRQCKVVKKWIYDHIKVERGSLSHGMGLTTALLSAISDIIVCFIVLCWGQLGPCLLPSPTLMSCIKCLDWKITPFIPTTRLSPQIKDKKQPQMHQSCLLVQQTNIYSRVLLFLNSLKH